jgi:hypothetical protein
MIAMPRLQADIIQLALADEPAVELVGDVPGDTAADAVTATGAQVAILGDRDGLPSTPFDLLASHPWLKLLSVGESDGKAVLYEYRPVITHLGEASPRVLVDAIIRVARPGGAEAPR